MYLIQLSTETKEPKWTIQTTLEDWEYENVIGTQHFDHAHYDLGASISVMPKVVFDQLNNTYLYPTNLQLQLADSLVRYPAGIVEDIQVKVRVLLHPHWHRGAWHGNWQGSAPLILGRPFFSTTNAQIGTCTIFWIRRMVKVARKSQQRQIFWYRGSMR
jgi:hypothetical protein